MKRSNGLLFNLGIKSPIAEAYRTLRTNLEFIRPDAPMRTLLVTSSGPGEGKSTTVANIAISMAQGGKKVLLIDCDLRKPVQHTIFGISNMNGLTNYLIDSNLSQKDVIQKTIEENLDLLVSGFIPPNPAELLSSQKMKKIIEEFKKQYDFIIFDTPPIISVTDAAIVSSFVDGVLLVVGSGLADKNMLKKAYQMLVNVNAHVLGVVLNRVQLERGYEHYYYYYSKGENHVG